jgi:probable rRNA maturation factor
MIVALYAADGEELPRGVRAPVVGLGRRLRPAGLRVHVIASGDALVRRFNRNFRGVDRSTDVLSFVYEARPRRASDDPDAEVYISMAKAKRQARQRGHTVRDEFVVLALHGLLHIQGHDHHVAAEAGRMRAAEARQLRWLRRCWPRRRPRSMMIATPRSESK